MTAPQPCCRIFYTVFYPVSSVLHALCRSGEFRLPVCSVRLHPERADPQQRGLWPPPMPSHPALASTDAAAQRAATKLTPTPAPHLQSTGRWAGKDRTLTAPAPNTKSPRSCTRRCHCFFPALGNPRSSAMSFTHYQLTTFSWSHFQQPSPRALQHHAFSFLPSEAR